MGGLRDFWIQSLYHVGISGDLSMGGVKGVSIQFFYDAGEVGDEDLCMGGVKDF